LWFKLIFSQFRAAVDAMHPVYVKLYNTRQKALEEGGSAALAETAAGGKDLITSMSMGTFPLISPILTHYISQFRPIGTPTRRIKCLMMLFLRI
jgi:hypothetical protein